MSEKLPEPTIEQQIMNFSEVDETTDGKGNEFLTGLVSDSHDLNVGHNQVLDAYGYNEDKVEEPAPAPASARTKPVGRSASGTGIADMEASAEAKLENIAAKKAIESKRNSPETALLNDKAELEIYGSRGRKYTDPKTGEVIATPKSPLVGKIESLRNDRSFGRQTEKARNDAADKYEADVNNLIGDDFELTQAKLIMDLRDQDVSDKNSLISEFMNNGMSAVDADKKAGDIYAKKDKNRKNIIEDNALMSIDEYRNFINPENAVAAAEGEDASSAGVDNSKADISGGEGNDMPDPDGAIEGHEWHEPSEDDIEYHTQPVGAAEAESDNPDNNTHEMMIAAHEIRDQQLDEARDRYAELTASSRGKYFGRFGGKYLSRIPGISHIQRGINKLSGKDKELAEARAEYVDNYNLVGGALAQAMKVNGLSQKDIAFLSAVGGIKQDAKLEDAIAGHREALSKPDSRFSNWWIRNTGKKGMLKKFAVVAAVGTTVGLAAPILPFVGAGISGLFAAGSGAMIGRNINKRRSNSDVNDESQAIARARIRHNEKSDLITDIHSEGEFHHIDDIINPTEQHTSEEMLENRQKVRKAAAAGGAILGAVGAVRKLHSFFDGTPDLGGKRYGGPDGPKIPDAADITPDTPDVIDAGPDINGLNFIVEDGHGITQEVNDFLASNGFDKLGPTESHDFYQELVSKFGEDNLMSTGTYEMPNGDFGIVQPGSARWSPEVAQYIFNKMSGAQSLNDLNDLSNLSDISGNLRIQ